jgi:DNA-binding PucR family transcriptional regulator
MQFAAWPTLGSARLLAQLREGWRDDLPRPLLQLLRDQPALRATLAAFLDAGGDVKATAETMSLHRSGVYYRLRRIEELTGLRMARGDDRLLAHMALHAEQLF